MNKPSKNIFYAIVFIVIALIAWSLVKPVASSKPEQTNITQIVEQVKNENVAQISIANNQITATLKDNKKMQAYIESSASLKDYGITPEKVNIKVSNPNTGTAWPTVLSILLPFLLIGGFIFFMLRQAQGGNNKAMNFGQSKAKLFTPGGKKTTFADVAGMAEAKQELYEVVEFLKSPDKFKKLGAEIPRGVLLVGPPGTGKTLLARAVAGEAGVPFFSISASEFVEMFVGVGAARVRDLFAKAKRNAPAILFIDELDAIGRQRGTGLGGSHDEREQTLNQILVEMDGFENDTRTIVMAATNRPDVLDPALLRPGRFDRRVMIDLPDLAEREAILKIHARNKPMNADVDFVKVARHTAGLSGAELKNIMNEAAIFAARENKKTIHQAQIGMSIEKVLIGPERKSRVMSTKEKEISAYHEVGHAVVGHILTNTDPIHKISVISRGMALGYTWSLPDEDKHLYSEDKFQDEIAQLLGGWVAEKMIFGQVTTGAQSDLRRATKIAHDMVTVYGMSEKLGPVVLSEREETVFLGRELGGQKNHSDAKAFQIDEEIMRIIKTSQKKAEDVLVKNKILVKKITAELIKKETIEGADFERFFKS